MEQHTCKNCGNQFEGNFCNVCGQKLAHRLDVKHILHEVTHVFTHADKGIFSFIPKVVTQPGIIALDYVDGKRKKYFNPLQYLVLMVGLATFLIAKSHFMDQIMETVNTMNDPNLPAKISKKQKEILEIFQKYMNIVMFMMMPVFAFFSWLFYKKEKYNFAEHVMIQIVLQGQSNTILLFTFYPLLFIFGMRGSNLLMILPLITVLLCYLITYTQFFTVSWWVALLKGIGIYVCATVVQTVITTIIGMAYALLTK